MLMKSLKKQKLIIVLFTFLIFFGNFTQAWAKSLSISVDQIQLEMGDVVNLTLQADFQVYTQSPDLTALKKNFEVLGQQQSNNMSMVNGQVTSTTQWLIQMMPKRAGELKIPSFTIDGVSSTPLTLKVTQPTLKKGALKSSFLTVKLNTQQAYVQQQVIYTLRYYHLGQLITGTMRPPKFGNALVKPLKKQFAFQKRINGKLYEVIEWKYAFYPQTSGTLKLDPVAFEGRIHWQGRLRAVQNITQPMTLKVLPKPVSYPKNQVWLPASQVKLAEKGLSPLKTIHVGDSLTRQIALKVVGQLASQLPNLTFPEGAGYHVYADKTEQKDKVDVNRGNTAVRQYKMAIVPTQAGELTLPKVTLNWWDTKTNQLKTITLPAHQLKVLPAIQTTSLPALPKVQANHSVKNKQIIQKTEGAKKSFIWQMMTAILAVLLLIILIYVVKLKRKLAQISLSTVNLKATLATEQPTHLALDCQQLTSAKSFYQFLQTQWLQQPDLKAKCLQNKDFNQGYQALKSHLYKQTILPENVLESLCHYLKNQPNQKANQTLEHQLLPFYP